jgi:hypothetical protein
MFPPPSLSPSNDHDSMELIPIKDPHYASKRFESWNYAWGVLIRHARANGYWMIIKRSKPDKSSKELKHTYYLSCDRYDKYKPKKAGIRAATSKATGCPYKIVIRKVTDPDSDVEPYWKFEVGEERHNYNPSSHFSAHAGCRRVDMQYREVASTDRRHGTRW